MSLEDLRKTRDYWPLRPYPKSLKATDHPPIYHYIIKMAPLSGTIVHSRHDTMEEALKKMMIFDRVKYPDTDWWVLSTPTQHVIDSHYTDRDKS